MLHRIPRLTRVSWQCIYRQRNYATTTEISTNTTPSTLFTQTFKKVTAYPFVADPWHAQAMMDVSAALLTSKYIPLLAKYHLYTSWQLKRGFLIHRLLNFCSYVYFWYLKARSQSRSLRLKAIYYPAWKVWVGCHLATIERNHKLQLTSFSLVDKYVPGSDKPRVLARNRFFQPPDAKEYGALPLAECLSPFGLDAECLPFTISPFSLLETARSTPTLDSKLVFQGGLVIPNSITLDMCAACPILIPYYSCKYTRPSTKNKPEQQFQLYTIGYRKIPEIGSEYPFAELEGPEAQTKVDETYERMVQDDKGFTDLRKYPMIKVVDILSKAPALRNDDDACIRVFKKEEIEPIVNYMELREKLYNAVGVDITTWPTTAKNEYMKELEKMRTRVEGYLPSWWTKSDMAKYSLVKAKPQEKDNKLLRSRSNPMPNFGVNPDTVPSSSNKTKRKDK